MATQRRAAARQAGGRPAGAGQNILQFYSDDSPGLQVGPTTVLIASLSFVGVVVLLHIVGKFRSRQTFHSLFRHNIPYQIYTIHTISMNKELCIEDVATSGTSTMSKEFEVSIVSSDDNDNQNASAMSVPAGDGDDSIVGKQKIVMTTSCIYITLGVVLSVLIMTLALFLLLATM
ncbi:protein transport protein Sec61 subunit beta [Mayamaea pseudoterrestris]|nr:protein transport protein Sec61 subunit beta [Mayamaea pseudoterrestris]